LIEWNGLSHYADPLIFWFFAVFRAGIPNDRTAGKTFSYLKTRHNSYIYSANRKRRSTKKGQSKVESTAQL